MSGTGLTATGGPLPQDVPPALHEDERTAVPRARIRHNDYGPLLPPPWAAGNRACG